MNGLSHTFWLNFAELDSLNSVIMAGGHDDKSVVFPRPRTARGAGGR